MDFGVQNIFCETLGILKLKIFFVNQNLYDFDVFLVKITKTLKNTGMRHV